MCVIRYMKNNRKKTYEKYQLSDAILFYSARLNFEARVHYDYIDLTAQNIRFYKQKQPFFDDAWHHLTCSI